jgi:acetylornithine deacetylase/succinyl-diaminopimelate desuccinylase-like protein
VRTLTRVSLPELQQRTRGASAPQRDRVSRILARLEEIYAIGQTRVGGSAEEDAAHRLASRWLEDAGLEVAVDAAGNLFGRRGDPTVWVGSHLDSVPGGGRFDGALGVVSAIEAAERLALPLAVVAFRDEERGCVGSRASVASGVLPAAYLELHVEQGPLLDSAGAPVGIVTAILGQARGEIVFEGRADHAGTTPMEAREDALVAAAEFVLRVRRAARGGARATVGRLVVEPGSSNVVPARVTLSVDARAASSGALDALVAEIGFQPSLRNDPVAMSDPPLAALRAAAPGAPELESGAGHDAAVLASAGVPSGMLFVRSRNGGASHSAEELTSEADAEKGLDVLVEALARIVR